MKLESRSESLQPSPSPAPVAVAVAIMAVQTLVWPMAALTWSTSSMLSSLAPKRASTLLSSCLDIVYSLCFFVPLARLPIGATYGQNVSSSEPPFGRCVNVSWHGGPAALTLSTSSSVSIRAPMRRGTRFDSFWLDIAFSLVNCCARRGLSPQRRSFGNLSCARESDHAIGNADG